MPIGISNFETIRKRDAYYVDKSSLISELIGSMAAVTLFIRPIIRPRRFGKTLIMSMLESFFNIEKNSKNFFIIIIKKTFIMHFLLGFLLVQDTV